MANCTPLNTMVDQVFMRIRNDPALAWPNKLKGNLNKRPRNKYCRFHRDCGHDTLYCYDLKQQIEALIKQGKLQRFVGQEKTDENPSNGLETYGRVEERPRAPFRGIRVIVRGITVAESSKSSRKTHLRMVQSVQITGRPLEHSRIGNPPIAFNEEDAR